MKTIKMIDGLMDGWTDGQEVGAVLVVVSWPRRSSSSSSASKQGLRPAPCLSRAIVSVAPGFILSCHLVLAISMRVVLEQLSRSSDSESDDGASTVVGDAPSHGRLFELPEGSSFLGRSRLLGIRDKRCSRKQGTWHAACHVIDILWQSARLRWHVWHDGC